MRGSELREAIKRRRNDQTHFIRWWRKENDFVDYELLEPFLRRLDDGLEFSGFELLDIGEMWQTLRRWVPDKVNHEQRIHKDVIVWKREQGSGFMTEELPFSAESIMHIFDRETGGDTVQ